MARLDVHPMQAGDGYVLDVQSGLLSERIGTRVVVPLLPHALAPKPIDRLNPVFDVRGERYVMVTQAIASVPTRELGRPIQSLAEQHEDVVRALDILFLGL